MLGALAGVAIYMGVGSDLHWTLRILLGVLYVICGLVGAVAVFKIWKPDIH